MSPQIELENRLRRGLHAAAEAVPPAPVEPPAPGVVVLRRGAPPVRRWALGLVATAAAGAAVVGAVAVAGPSGGGDDVRLEPTQETPAPPDAGEPILANGMVPGQAVIVGTELRTYGPDGSQTGTMSLAPLEDVQAASSDLAGGWVACGIITTTPERSSSPPDYSTTTVPVTSDGAVPDGSPPGAFADPLVWFPADGEPVVVESAAPLCMADAVRVVDSPEGPTAVYLGDFEFTLHAVVLATGEDRIVNLPVDSTGFYRWSASTGRVVVNSDETGPQLFDLTTGEVLPTVPIDIGGASDVVLSPNGVSLAALTGDPAEGPSNLVVYDLATGAELFRERVDMPLEGAQLSYDGTTVAVGNFYDGYDDVVYPPVAVIDLASGARHTIDVHGLVL